MGRMSGRMGLAALLVAALLALGAGGALGQEGDGTTTSAPSDEELTLTVGLTHEIDSPNVTVGYTVAAYEVWNLQYATLTDEHQAVWGGAIAAIHSARNQPCSVTLAE